ncbi:MAG: efflux RND transporter periplasmic adaptor subunit, partial [Vulcanimicrobiaceae bacterium]
MKILERPHTNGHAKIELQPIPPKGYWRRSYSAILAVVVIVALIAGSWAVFRPRATAAVVTQLVTEGTLTQSVTATGTVNPQDTVNVGTQVSGTISQLFVDYNSKVKKGQVLAKIDPTSLLAALQSARASLAQSQAQAAAGTDNAIGSRSSVTAAQANVAADQQAIASAKAQIAKAQSASALAQQTVSRDKQLLSQGFISQSQYDTDNSNAVAAQSALQAAQIAVTQAQAQAAAQVATTAATTAQAQGAQSTAAASQAAIGIQEAQVAQAQYNLNNSVITSPVDGTVIARDISVGQTVAAGLQTPTLFALAKDLTKMEADLQVGEPDIGNVRPGDAVSFTVLAYPTRTFSGTVTQVRQNPTTVSNVVTYTTVVDVNNQDGALLPGMTANATINVASVKNATIVPVAALQWHPAAGQVKARKPSSTTAKATTSQGSANPWGTTGSAGSATVVAGTRGRVFISQGKTVQMVPVNIQMISGTNAAVSPIRGTLAAGASVIVGGGATATHARTVNANSSP